MSKPIDRFLEAENRPTVVVAAVVLVSILAGVAFLGWWNARTQPIFATRPHSVLGHVHQNLCWPDYSSQQHAPHNAPIMVASVWSARVFGASYANEMRAQTALYAVLILCLAWIAGRLAGAFAAGFAALAGAFCPAILLGALAFDDQLFNMAATAAIVALLVESIRRERWWSAALSGLIGVVVWRFAFVPSNAVLVLGCVACASLGMMIDVAVSGRVGTGASVSTRARLVRPWIGAMAVFSAVLATGIALAEFVRDVPLEYYSREAANVVVATKTSMDVIRNLVLYFAQMWNTDLGAVLCVAVMVGSWRLFRSKLPYRFAALFWLLLPLVVLSAVPKKNAYYILPCLTAAPVVIAAGVATLSTRIRFVAAILFTAGVWGISIGWFTGTLDHEPISASWARHYQEMPTFTPGPPQAGTTPEKTFARMLAADIARARPDGCPRLVVVAPGAQSRHFMNRLNYFLLEQDPRIALLEIGQIRRVPFEDPAPLILDLNPAPDATPPVDALRGYAMDQSRGASPFGRSGGALYLETVLRDHATREVARSERYALWAAGADHVEKCPRVVR